VTNSLGRVFIVGIGGAGMSGLARILKAQGLQVAGSDAKDSKRLRVLAAEGIEVFIGHDASHLLDDSGSPRFDTLAASTAVPATNPEIVRAREVGIKVLNRAELLVALTDGFEVISVAGTHGKTTTTSMLTIALQSAGLDPSFAIGSELNESGSNAHLGSGKYFVVEADESDGTFLDLNSQIGIVTNLEADHLNYWGTLEKLEQGFLDFATKLKSRGGFLVACVDDAGAAELVTKARALGVEVRTYGQSKEADYQIELLKIVGIGWQYQISKLGVTVQLMVPGVHNVLNSAAALIVAAGLGLDLQTVAKGLESFTGTRRRFDFKGEAAGVRVFDDYAHHPTEITATLKAARDVVGDGKVIVAFQAHHYYRTALFSKEFGEALSLADYVVVLEVFAPGEEFIPGASGETLAGNVLLSKEKVKFQPSWSLVASDLVEHASAGDLIMTLGAGEIGLLTKDVLQLLSESQQASK
jgi:UDP-N-acetylmuramate--alanine ligase